MKNELIRLQKNLQKLIQAGYSDDIANYILLKSYGIQDLNSRIEDELSYAK